MDRLYANKAVLKEINDRKWQYIIVFPADKLTIIDRQLKEQQANWVFIPVQLKYHDREQQWHWENNLHSRGFSNSYVVSCFETWFVVNKKQGILKLNIEVTLLAEKHDLNVLDIWDICNNARYHLQIGTNITSTWSSSTINTKTALMILKMISLVVI